MKVHEEGNQKVIEAFRAACKTPNLADSKECKAMFKAMSKNIYKSLQRKCCVVEETVEGEDGKEMKKVTRKFTSGPTPANVDKENGLWVSKDPKKKKKTKKSAPKNTKKKKRAAEEKEDATPDDYKVGNKYDLMKYPKEFEDEQFRLYFPVGQGIIIEGKEFHNTPVLDSEVLMTISYLSATTEPIQNSRQGFFTSFSLLSEFGNAPIVWEKKSIKKII